MIRDGGLPGGNTFILEAAPVIGGSWTVPEIRWSVFHRGGHMVTTDNYECTWDLYKSIPSLNNEGQTVFEETVEFNEKHPSNAMARLVTVVGRRCLWLRWDSPCRIVTNC